MHIIYNRPKLGIQSTLSEFKVIRFMNSKREQVRKSIKNKEIMAYLANILAILNNNDFLFKNNIEYI